MNCLREVKASMVHVVIGLVDGQIWGRVDTRRDKQDRHDNDERIDGKRRKELNPLLVLRTQKITANWRKDTKNPNMVNLPPGQLPKYSQMLFAQSLMAWATTNSPARTIAVIARAFFHRSSSIMVERWSSSDAVSCSRCPLECEDVRW